ncbi:MAG: hypothetical protein ACT4N2_11250, partial [Hyphomicrobium sp.]
GIAFGRRLGRGTRPNNFGRSSLLGLLRRPNLHFAPYAIALPALGFPEAISPSLCFPETERCKREVIRDLYLPEGPISDRQIHGTADQQLRTFCDVMATYGGRVASDADR